MTNLTSVTLTSGLPTAGTGTVSTIDNLANITVPVSIASLPSGAVTNAGTFATQSKITDGTSTAAVKAASTAPIATDPSLVVAISPNSINANGQATMADSAPVVLASNQSTLNVVGTGTAGTPGTAVLTVQGISGGTAIPVTGTYTGTYLWDTGTSNNGLLTSVVTLMTTEIASLSSGSVIISSVNGASGVFNTTNTGGAILGEIYFSEGNAGNTPVAGGNVTGWFLTTPDGSTYESITAVPPRAPDFIVPLPAGAITTALFKANGLVNIPALPFKVLIQNNSGANFGAGATTAGYLKLAPVAYVF